MSYGLLVRNASSIIQIGEDYSNYYLHQEGVVSVGPNGASVSYSSVEGALPLVATRAASVGVAIQSVSSTQVFLVSSSSVSVPYRIYMPSTNVTAPSGYGLVVKNSANKIVFDSTRKQLRVLQLINYTEVARNPSSPEAPREFNHSLGHRFVIHSHACVRRGTMIMFNGGPVAWILAGLISINNKVAIADTYVRSGWPWTDTAYPYYDGLPQTSIALIGD